MRYVEAAMDRDTSHQDERELSVLQRLLRSNSGDPRIAVIMAFDLFLVGIDTVSDANILTSTHKTRLLRCAISDVLNYINFIRI